MKFHREQRENPTKKTGHIAGIRRASDFSTAALKTGAKA